MPKTPGLQSHTASTRQQALEAHCRECDTTHRAELEEATRIKREADAKHAKATAEARELVEATRRRRAELLAEEARETIGPLVAERMAQPTRAVDRQIHEALLELDAKVRDQVDGGIGAGTAVSPQFVLTLFADEVLKRFPNAVALFQSQDLGTGPAFNRLGALQRALKGSPLAFGAWCDDVERTLEDLASRCPHTANARHRAMYQVTRSTVSLRDAMKAHEALSSEWQAEDQAANAKRSDAALKAHNAKMSRRSRFFSSGALGSEGGEAKPSSPMGELV